MQKIFTKLKGDKAIWAIVALLAIFSFLPVYSAASNLANISNGNSTLPFLIKHFMHLLMGFFIMYGVHKVPYQYFKGLSIVMIPIVLVLLVVTFLQGTVLHGANASRWIRIPIVNMSFQTSALASVTIMVFVARYLSKIKDKSIRFKESIWPLWIPVFLILLLILPANFSTTAIIFAMVLVLSYIGGYPLKYLMVIIGFATLGFTVFVLTAKVFPNAMPNRVDTWISRIDNFANEKDTDADYQIEKAKIAIASGYIQGLGPGKSVQKHFLPQSTSDFIFAIIIEEYGLLGALFLLLTFTWLLFRIVIVSQKSETIFGKLLALSVGIPVVFQALINMGVAVELFPVTGQTLPLISSGGTSIWMTCLSIGIILSISAKRNEIKQQDNHERNPLDILSETT